MKNVFLFLTLFVTAAAAQDVPSRATDYCAEGKTRYFGSVARRQQARQMAPMVQAVGDSTIDATYYGLDLNITYSPNYLRGATTVHFRVNVPSLRQFYLDFNTNMKVDSVKSGAQRLTYTHANNRLSITLPQALTRAQGGSVRVFYQGLPSTPNAGLTDQAFVFSTHETTRDPLVYTLSEPYGASDWFPCKDVPADKADSSAVNITMPALFVSASNGVLQGITENPDGTKTYRWKNSYPIAQYLISIACSNYAQYDNPFTYNGVTMPVTHFIFPEDLTAVRASLTSTNTMLRVFSDLFGTYPFIREKYGHAQFRWSGGMEHQTLSSMVRGAMIGPDIIAHELMHQWFGDKITCRDWQNIWLNEGFATYGEALYAEATGGRTAYMAYVNNDMAQARNAAGTLYVQNVNSLNEIFSGNRSYAKGAVVLHMLRGVLGDSTFFRGMRAYANAPALAYNTAVTEDFQRVMEQQSGRSLGYFFRQWIYGERFPAYQWSVAPIAGTNQAVLRIQQGASTNPSSFTMPVQVTLESAVGNQTLTIFNDQPVQSFTLTGSGPVTGAVFDPNNWILKTATQVAPPAGSSVLAVQEALDLRVFPNPTADQLTVEFTMQQPGPVTLLLVNLLGQPVATYPETSVPVGPQRRTVSFSSVPAGQYVLRLETADGVRSAAVIR
jgi:aminopeptidase N